MTINLNHFSIAEITKNLQFSVFHYVEKEICESVKEFKLLDRTNNTSNFLVLSETEKLIIVSIKFKDLIDASGYVNILEAAAIHNGIKVISKNNHFLEKSKNSNNYFEYPSCIQNENSEEAHEIVEKLLLLVA